MAFCIECGIHLPDAAPGCPGCRSGSARLTQETVFTEVRLPGEKTPTQASVGPPGANCLAVAVFVVAGLVLGVVALLIVNGGLVGN